MDLSEAVFVYSNSQSNIDGVVFGPDETKEYFITEHQVHDVQQALDTFFGHPCHFVVITTEKRSEESARNLQNVISIPNDKTEWKGSDRDWNSAFRKLGLLSTTRQLFQFIRPSL